MPPTDVENQVNTLKTGLDSINQENERLEAEIRDALKLGAVIEYYLAAVDLRFNGEDVTGILESLSNSAIEYGDSELATLTSELRLRAANSFGGDIETRLLRRLRLILETTLVEM